MNKPFTKAQVEALPMGYNPTTTFLGYQEVNGKKVPIYYPNRRTRKLRPKKAKSSQTVIFGTQNPKDTDIILKEYTSNKGTFYHVKRKIKHYD